MSSTPPPPRPPCTGSRTVSLTVLPDAPAPRPRRVGHSRMGRRRAAVLIAVHVLIVIHIIHWLAAGRTVSPVEPSESMETIETGVVNAGAIFLLVAILSTLIFGRFFCGWACHVVALQDLCAWLMKKCGIRPVPFRSRLLTLIPLILGFYMFLWPTLLKGVLEPALDAAWPEARAALGPLPGVPTEFRNELVQEDFWSTFPTIAVAIPFLFVCGFATVYFLGAKGFCTYGCPYGGIFAPVDRIAPGRIVVDHDKCEGCGHCTAVCSSNVRVHDEIREYGMVVDPGCMKCMDCVSVCPNDALSFAFTRPAVAKGKPRNRKPRRTWDTSIPEDLALGAVFFLAFFIARGTYPVVPMLFAVGIAGCVTFLAWKTWCLFRRPNVRIAPFQLRLRSRLRPAGAVLLASSAFLSLLFAHTAFVKYHNWQGLRTADQAHISKAQLLTPTPRTFSVFEIDALRESVRHFETGASFRRGGLALMDQPAARTRHALVSLALGAPEVAEAYLRGAIERSGPTNDSCADLAALLTATGRSEEALALCRQWLAANPDLWLVRDHIANHGRVTGHVDDAIADARRLLDDIGDDRARHEIALRTHLQLARMLAWRTRFEEAEAHYVEYLAEHPEAGEVRNEYCMMLSGIGRPDDALARARADLDALTREEPRRQALLTLARLHAIAGRFDDADEAFTRALELRPWDSAARREACATLFSGRPARALEIAGAVEEIPRRYRYRAAREDARRLHAELLMQTGRAEQAVDAWTTLLDESPRSLRDLESLCQFLARIGRIDDAVERCDRFITALDADDDRDLRLQARLLAARLALVDNRATDARAILDDVLAQEPLLWPAIELKARLLVAENDLPGAIAFCDNSLAAHGDEPWNQPGAARTALLTADLRARANDPDGARAAVAGAVERQPHVAAYRRLAADVQRTLPGGDRAVAAQQLQAATRLDPFDPEGWLQLGLVSLALQDDAQAAAAFRTALRLTPGNPDVMTRIEEACRALGKPRIWAEDEGSASDRQPH